jgi:endonuclease/exonuclease/phosphatase family metal-dependent hydrolase
MVPLRLVQFNILAPSARICKPLDQVPWRKRHGAICDSLSALAADVILLQEYDFSPSTAGFHALYVERLGRDFDVHLLKRTGRKVDGLALFVRRSAFRDVEVEEVELEPRYCDRVALVARMTHVESGQPVVVSNTHLTVAHASNGHDIPLARPQQMEQLLARVAGSRAQAASAAGVDSDNVLVLLCGDMNCDHLEDEPPEPCGQYRYTVEQVSEPVHACFRAGYVSALHEVLGREDARCGSGASGGASGGGGAAAAAAAAAAPGASHAKSQTQCKPTRPCSHTCSYAQDGCADYVFVNQDVLSLKLLGSSNGDGGEEGKGAGGEGGGGGRKSGEGGASGVVATVLGGAAAAAAAAAAEGAAAVDVVDVAVADIEESGGPWGGRAELCGAFLFPESIAPDMPWDPVAGWGGAGAAFDVAVTLSDHRPLVVDLRLASLGDTM